MKLDFSCFQYFKDTRWKQITTMRFLSLIQSCCFQYFKDTRWKQITTFNSTLYSWFVLFSIFQRYKMKANHNSKKSIFSLSIVVFNISKIQDESKSQPSIDKARFAERCFQYFKDTRWKQITTVDYANNGTYCCFQYFKDTRWKQITTQY